MDYGTRSAVCESDAAGGRRAGTRSGFSIRTCSGLPGSFSGDRNEPGAAAGAAALLQAGRDWIYTSSGSVVAKDVFDGAVRFVCGSGLKCSYNAGGAGRFCDRQRCAPAGRRADCGGSGKHAEADRIRYAVDRDYRLRISDTAGGGMCFPRDYAEEIAEGGSGRRSSVAK